MNPRPPLWFCTVASCLLRTQKAAGLRLSENQVFESLLQYFLLTRSASTPSFCKLIQKRISKPRSLNIPLEESDYWPQPFTCPSASLKLQHCPEPGKCHRACRLWPPYRENRRDCRRTHSSYVLRLYFHTVTVFNLENTILNQHYTTRAYMILQSVNLIGSIVAWY